MIEVRFHGRGGQGSVVASKILAAAAFKEGNDVQAFPYFGVERRGAPVTAFTKIDDRPIRNKSQIYEPDYIVVLDSSLVQSIDVSHGLKDGGIIIINDDHPPSYFESKFDATVATVDARSIAIDKGLGSRNAPIVNTAILGAFAKATGVVSIEAVEEAVLENAPAKPEKNAEASREAYEQVITEG